MLNRWTMVTAAALVAVSGAMAQEKSAAEKTLKVGDKAPALTVEDWVKGKKFEKFENGKVYVVEFWATWCGPCIEGIPHLTELQKDYKDKNVTIIGVASSERGDDNSAKLKKVEDFVKKQGDKMGYTVVYDSDRSMSKDWMAPAGRKTIPSAFLVNAEGKIAWIGDPRQGMDAELKKAVEGNKRTGMKDSDSSRQVASSDGGKTSGSSGSSSSTSGSSDSRSSSTSSSSSGGEKKSSSSSSGEKKSSSSSSSSEDKKSTDKK